MTARINWAAKVTAQTEQLIISLLPFFVTITFMEMVDIVTEADEVVGQTSKEEAHKTGALHRTVIAEVINSKGEWLLVKQASDRQDAGQFVSPVGGHVQSGENEDDALKREAFEELGLENIEYSLVGKTAYYREVIGRKENHLFVVYEIKSDAVPKLNHESVAYEYFSPQALMQEVQTNPHKFGKAFHFVLKTIYKKAY